MNNQIQIFTNAQFGEIRTCGTSEKPMFCLVDVCKALGIKNPSDCKRRLSIDGVVTTEGVSTTTNQYGKTTEQKTMLTFITEANLYKCIFMSRKPEAEKFQDWVTSEVLPSIRKHGLYMTEAAVMKAITDPDSFIELALNLKRQREEHHLQIEQKDAQIAKMQEQVHYLDHIMESDDHMCISTIAVDYGMSGVQFNRELRKYGVLQNKTIDGVWQPTEEFRGKGYCDVVYRYDDKGHPFPNPELKWTHAGRRKLYEVLKGHGLVPVSERPKESTLFDNME